MKISYAVTVCNEFIEIQRLVTFLLEHKRPQDEIVVQMDLSLDDLKDCPPTKREVFGYIMKHNEQGNIRVVFCPLNNDFAAFKNHLTAQCEGDYIFQIDADEVPNENLMEMLQVIVDENPDCEVFLVPRINTVEGLTPEHIAKWGWSVNERGWVNFPDYQWRIWKNIDTISWKNKVHEVLNGHQTYTGLPIEEVFCLYHPKTIDKQERQNEYYETI